MVQNFTVDQKVSANIILFSMILLILKKILGRNILNDDRLKKRFNFVYTIVKYEYKKYFNRVDPVLTQESRYWMNVLKQVVIYL